jgi:HEAT repeat protein
MVRKKAPEALGRFGADSKDATAPVARALGDVDVNVRRAAAAALGKIGPAVKETEPGANDVVSALRSAQRDGDQQVRDAAGYSLAKINKR